MLRKAGNDWLTKGRGLLSGWCNV